MNLTDRHIEIEERFLEVVAEAGLPEPDDIARLSRALIFLWYDTKAFVLVDLEELPDDEEPLDALDIEALRADVLPGPGAPFFPPGYFEAA
jgi:hypothetical protein